jgi:predicted nucleic acid-binding Zn ribbon protein
MAKRKRRNRTFSEKVMLVLSILIALSMVLALFASFAPQAFGG